MHRRRLLAIVGTAALAGCLGDGSDETPASENPETNPETDTPTATPPEAPTKTPTVTPTATETATSTPTTSGPSRDPETVRENAQSVSWEDLFRNFEDHQDKAIYFEYAQIYQAIYEENYMYFQANVANNEEQFEGDVALTWYGDERLLEDDYLEVWGVAVELITYETVQGNERTIPLLELIDFELREQ